MVSRIKSYLMDRWIVWGHRRETKGKDTKIGRIDALNHQSALNKAKSKYGKKWTVTRVELR